MASRGAFFGQRAKDFQKCLKNIRTFTDGQAAMLDWDSDGLTNIEVQLHPNGGLYEGGRFHFKINIPERYPEEPPKVTCLTNIYHPNINMESSCDYNVCFSLFDEWSDGRHGLEDVINGLLFLLNYPNLEDPWPPFFDCSMSEKVLTRNIKRSLAGMTLEDVELTFPHFVDYDAEKYDCKSDAEDEEEEEEKEEEEKEEEEEEKEDDQNADEENKEEKVEEIPEGEVKDGSDEQSTTDLDAEAKDTNEGEGSSACQEEEMKESEKEGEEKETSEDTGRDGTSQEDMDVGDTVTSSIPDHNTDNVCAPPTSDGVSGNADNVNSEVVDAGLEEKREDSVQVDKMNEENEQLSDADQRIENDENATAEASSHTLQQQQQSTEDGQPITNENEEKENEKEDAEPSDKAEAKKTLDINDMLDKLGNLIDTLKPEDFKDEDGNDPSLYEEPEKEVQEEPEEEKPEEETKESEEEKKDEQAENMDTSTNDTATDNAEETNGTENVSVASSADQTAESSATVTTLSRQDTKALAEIKQGDEVTRTNSRLNRASTFNMTRQGTKQCMSLSALISAAPRRCLTGAVALSRQETKNVLSLTKTLSRKRSRSSESRSQSSSSKIPRLSQSGQRSCFPRLDCSSMHKNVTGSCNKNGTGNNVAAQMMSGCFKYWALMERHLDEQKMDVESIIQRYKSNNIL